MLPNEFPLVTIVIPAYNGMPYVKDAIDSVLKQDYPQIEIIVLDDGSKDDTAEFIKHHYAGQFHFASHPNQGQAATLNSGWSLAHGEILAYLSADDTLAPDAVSKSVQCLLQHPEVILTYGDNMLIDADSAPIKPLIVDEYNFLELYTKGASPVAVGSFFWRSAFERTQGWNTRYRCIGDYEFQLRLANLGTFKKVEGILGCHRVHKGSISYGSWSAKQADEFKDLMINTMEQTDNPQLLALKNYILAQAYLLTGRAHFRSQRWLTGGKYFLRAIIKCPRILLSARTYRIILNTVLSRTFYVLHNLVWKKLRLQNSGS